MGAPVKIIGGLLDRVVLVAGVVTGGTLPSFVAQYRQRVGGALDQVLQDLAPFQEIARQQYGGNMQALIDHHLQSVDVTFHREGAAIAAMVESAQRLGAAAKALDSDLWHQLLYLAGHIDTQMLSATWSIFKPAFGLTAESLLLAALSGLLLWLCFLGLWRGGGACWERFGNRRPMHAYRK